MAPKKTQKRGRKKKDDSDDEWDDGNRYQHEEDNSITKIPGKRNSSSKQDPIQEEPPLKDFSNLSLKPDHASRPIWVTPNGEIFLEAFSPIYQQAYDFLVAIAEPISRPEHIHEYRITAYSLYAAVAVSIDTESIIRVLQRLCKTELPNEVTKYIKDCTRSFGKAKLVLKDNKYYVESSHPDVLRELLRNGEILDARIPDIDTAENSQTNTNNADFVVSLAPQEMQQNLEYRKIGQTNEDDDLDEEVMLGGDRDRPSTVSFRITKDRIEDVKRCAQSAGYPLMEEYDFRNDNVNPLLAIDLRPSTRIRIYQEKSLSKMFGNGRARSGIIVLPCGAGKTLTGVTAASTIKRATIVLCINTMSVKQWKEQFQLWTTVPENRICMFTSDFKDTLPPPTEACIVLTTYTMITASGKRADDAIKMMNALRSREWGFMILDEVHVTPANKFRKVLSVISAHCKLGLTATLVREDNLIGDLNFLVGPKLYEANWMDLTQQGYLASVLCAEVWCPMTAEFYREYLRNASSRRRQELLYILNPRKFRACEYLVKYHEERGDKIIIFSDDVCALILYSEALQRPYIYGGTVERERRMILTSFKTHPEVNCIGLSKVGDTALDIPEANVVIQVSSHFGARRQEAQRLGRILRPKSNQSGGFNAFFYTLVSTDTREMYFSAKRQQYLIDQGYTYKIIPDLVDVADKESKLLNTKNQEVDLLNKVLMADFKELDEKENSEILKSFEDDEEAVAMQSSAVRRRVSTLSSLSGADGTGYLEYENISRSSK